MCPRDKIQPIQIDNEIHIRHGVQVRFLTEYPRFAVGINGKIWQEDRQRFISGDPNNKAAPQVSVSVLATREQLEQLKADGLIQPSARRYRIKKALYLVCRLVATAWVVNPNPDKYKFVDHIDNDRMNNHPLNLQWMTHQQNQHKCFHIDHPDLGKRIRSKVSPELKRQNAIKAWMTRRKNILNRVEV